ncbi:MAG: hypothetical protein ACTS5F_02175 [Candidatus Hodgkinia cicadicola]
MGKPTSIEVKTKCGLREGSLNVNQRRFAWRNGTEVRLETAEDEL